MSTECGPRLQSVYRNVYPQPSVAEQVEDELVHNANLTRITINAHRSIN